MLGTKIIEFDSLTAESWAAKFQQRAFLVWAFLLNDHFIHYRNNKINLITCSNFCLLLHTFLGAYVFFPIVIIVINQNFTPNFFSKSTLLKLDSSSVSFSEIVEHFCIFENFCFVVKSVSLNISIVPIFFTASGTTVSARI